jgi:hypothetical protein
MSVILPDLWSLTFGRPWIDPADLAAMLEWEVGQPLDYRTRLLIRDSLDALSRHWGPDLFDAWLEQSPSAEALEAIRKSDFDDVGFPSLERRIVDSLSPQAIQEFMRELGTRLRRPTRITIGGSIALILSGELRRATDDIDVVDELPVEIRNDHDLLDELASAHGLRLTHFQSHYLPSGWSSRVRSLGTFGQLSVYLVDSCDIFLSKLCSARRKDLDDVRMLARQLDKVRIETRLREAGASLLGEPKLAANAARNWYILYGEPLPGS